MAMHIPKQNLGAAVVFAYLFLTSDFVFFFKNKIQKLIIFVFFYHKKYQVVHVHMQRDREHDTLLSKWNDWFCTAPRPNQEQLFHFCNSHVKGTRPSVLQAPTGSGKSFIGEFVGILSNSPTKNQVVFICHTTNLQTQVYTDAADRVRRAGKIITTLFGKNRYFCVHLMENVNLSLLEISDNMRAVIRRVLQDYCRQVEENPPDHEMWAMPFDLQVLRALMKEGIPESVAKQVWEQVNSTQCKKERNTSAEGHGCLQRLQREKTKLAHFAIINSSIVMKYAAHQNLKLLFARTCVTIWDEAHTIAAAGDLLCEALAPKQLNFTHLQECLAEYASHHLAGKIVGGTVDMNAVVNIDQLGKLVFDEQACTKICLYSEIDINIWKESMRHISEMDTLRQRLARVLKIVSDKENGESDDSEIESDQESNNSEDEGDIPAEELQQIKCRRVKDALRACLTSEMADETHAMCDAWCDTIQTCFDRPDRVANCILYSMCLKEMAWKMASIFKAHPCAECIAMAAKLCNYSHTADIGCLREKTNNIIELLRSIDLLNLAKNKTTWLTSDNANIIPIVTDTEIRYQATEQHRSNMLRKYVWEPLATYVTVPAFLMSATIANLSDKDDFFQFKRDAGLLDVTTRVTPVVFDTRQVTLYHPYLKMWNMNKMTESDLAKNLTDRINETVMLIRLNPKGTLIVGTHKELGDIKPRLQVLLPLCNFILYKDDEQEVARFKDDSNIGWENIVILGSDKMYTGLDLPNKIGLVVIFRALNQKPDPSVVSYNRLIDPEYDETNTQRVIHRRLMRQIQAMGRLMRKSTDCGIVAFLSHHPNDLKSIVPYYPDAKQIRTKWELMQGHPYMNTAAR